MATPGHPDRERQPIPAGGVLLAGGTAVRLDGADKASLELAGRTLLESALAALAEVAEVVVVGEPVPTSRPVSFCREGPPGGGPAAGLLAGLDLLARLPGAPEAVVVLAVDMPRVRPDTIARLAGRAAAADGSVLVSADGRRQPLCAVYHVGALRRAARTAGSPSGHGLSMRRLTAALDLAEVPARSGEDEDVDTWADLLRLREELAGPPGARPRGADDDR